MKSLTAEEAETVDNVAGTVDSDGAFSGKVQVCAEKGGIFRL